MNAGFKTKPKRTNIANCIQARDYKGVANQPMTVVKVKNADKRKYKKRI